MGNDPNGNPWDNPILIKADSNGILQVSVPNGGGVAAALVEVDADAVSGAQFGLAVASFAYGWDGAAWDRARIATIFKTVIATAAGNTAVWTPAAGKQFRLMGYSISIAGTLAATGVLTVELVDQATVIKNHVATVAQTTPTGDTQIGIDLGQGQLSAAANNILQVNLSVAMATGGVAVNAWGTEE
jgi:hypothetical protein